MLRSGLLAASVGDSDLTGIAGWAVDLMSALGPSGVAIAIFLENLWPPIPSEIILPLAGFTAAQGGFTIVEAVAFATAGSLLGAWLLYGLGRVFGHERLVAIAERMPLVRADDIDRTTAWFRRHGGKAVFFGRMLPVFRSLISIPAGLEKMRFWLFSLLTLLGSAIWNTVFIGLGFVLGESWDVIGPWADSLQYLVLAVVAAVILVWVIRRIREDRARKRASS